MTDRIINAIVAVGLLLAACLATLVIWLPSVVLSWFQPPAKQVQPRVWRRIYRVDMKR